MAAGTVSEMNFTYIPGVFKHDQQPTGPDKGFRAHTLPNFGILDRSYDTEDREDPNLTQWQRLERHLLNLNAKDRKRRQYRVLFVARHGEGIHNVKEREVGRHEWESKWAKLDGDGTVTWRDASLTSKGKQQAVDIGSFWEFAIRESKVPAPQRYFSSPLTRCLETASLSFANVHLPPDRPFRLTVKEALREIHGVHTCDKRSSRHEIQSKFPSAVIEPGFAEEDELWQPTRRETLEERIPLMRQFLTGLFEDADATFVSIATHSGAIRALYMAIAHPDVWVAAGAVVPIVVCMDKDA